MRFLGNRRHDHNLGIKMLASLFLSQNPSLDETIQNPNNLRVVFYYSQCCIAFQKYCEQKKFNAFWIATCSYFGRQLIGDPTYTQVEIVGPTLFNQAKGLFYYQEALITETEITKQYLELAVSLLSPHAIYRVNLQLYEAAEKDQKSAPSLYKEAISNAKLLINNYGTFGYILLGEAYLRLAIHSKSTHNMKNAVEELKDANICLMKAKEFEKRSILAIHNATFGQGLSASNSLGRADILKIDIKDLCNINFSPSKDTQAFTDILAKRS